jgi:hypothetical protein
LLFCRKIRSKNPGDVEDYFPKALRYLILRILGQGGAGQEGEGSMDPEERETEEVWLKVERDLADLRWLPTARIYRLSDVYIWSRACGRALM